MSHSKGIAALLGLQTDASAEYRKDRIYPDDINVLIQPRLTFEEEGLKRLGKSIRNEGLLHPLIVVQYEADECEEHLTLVNRARGTDYTLADLTPMHIGLLRRKVYTILIAGERRYKSIIRCPENHPGFFRRGIPVRVRLNVTPLRALKLQFSENLHKEPPPHEEARAIAGLYRVIEEDDPDLTRTAFAEQVDRSPSTVLAALRFCDLPMSIQERVEDGTIPYGIGVELARLKEEGVEEKDLENWMLRAILSRKTVEEFHEDVSSYLVHKKNGQGTLFEFTPKEARDARRRTVEQGTLHYRWSMIHYNRRVLELLEEGLLGKEESPYAEGSVVNTIQAQVDELEKLLRHRESLLPKKYRGKALKVLAASEVQNRLLLRKNGDGDKIDAA